MIRFDLKLFLSKINVLIKVYEIALVWRKKVLKMFVNEKRLVITNKAFLLFKEIVYLTIKNSERLFLACSSSVQLVQGTTGSLSPKPFPVMRSAGIPLEITY